MKSHMLSIVQSLIENRFISFMFFLEFWITYIYLIM